ncbi:MAG: AraC family transcriptional regulator [Pseudomonadota bacterium]
MRTFSPVSTSATRRGCGRSSATEYLADAKLAVSEVAYLIGYSEPSAFHRTFKRWTGMTPKEMRARAA